MSKKLCLCAEVVVKKREMYGQGLRSKGVVMRCCTDRKKKLHGRRERERGGGVGRESCTQAPLSSVVVLLPMRNRVE